MPDPQNSASSPLPQTQYDFIVNPEKPPKKSRLPKIGGGSFVGRLLVIVLGATLLIILAIVIFSFLSSASNAQKQKFTDLIVEQTKLLQVATHGSVNARNPDLRDKAMVTKYALQSDQVSLKVYLKKQGVKLDEKYLKTIKDTESDSALGTATLNNQYDQALDAILTKNLTTYKKNVNDLYQANSGKNIRQILSVMYNNASNILAPPATKT